MGRRLKRYWRKTAPDLVVSLIPNFNRMMYEGLETAKLGTPYVTILTDFADYPPEFWSWVESRLGFYLMFQGRK